jgi:acetyl/propionyl-CoA carboxylase alpha subunit
LRKILIADRGEIAVRAVRAGREAGSAFAGLAFARPAFARTWLG